MLSVFSPGIIMEIKQPFDINGHKTPPLNEKIKLYISSLLRVPFYRYGEIGNLLYTIGKNILDGVILYTMFTMAEEDLKVAAILGVVVKYAYPGITMISSTYTSGFIDRLEAFKEIKTQISKLIKVHFGIAFGQALGAVFLLSCFPPVFKYLFNDITFKSHLLIVIYFLHHVCDGSAQIIEGRTWFKIIEIKIRKCELTDLSQHFWVIYTTSQNFQLLLGQLFLWSALWVTSSFTGHLSSHIMSVIVFLGFILVAISKFILPITYKLKICS